MEISLSWLEFLIVSHGFTAIVIPGERHSSTGHSIVHILLSMNCSAILFCWLYWDNRIPRLQVDVNIMVDILVSRGVQNVVELTNVVKHTILVKQIIRLLTGQGLVHLIAFQTEDGKFCFFTHNSLLYTSGKAISPVSHSRSKSEYSISVLYCQTLVSSCSSAAYSLEV